MSGVDTLGLDLPRTPQEPVMLSARQRHEHQRNQPPNPPEVLLEAPIGFGMMLDAAEDLTDRGEDTDLDGLAQEAMRAGLVAGLERFADQAGWCQRRGGWVPGQLDMRPDMHRFAGDDETVSRPHVHLRIAPTVSCPLDGKRYNTASHLVREAALPAQTAFSEGIRLHLVQSGIAIARDVTGRWGWDVDAVAHLSATVHRVLCPPEGRPLANQVAPLGHEPARDYTLPAQPRTA